jgi:lipopolysaccharide export system protein LptC
VPTRRPDLGPRAGPWCTGLVLYGLCGGVALADGFAPEPGVTLDLEGFTLQITGADGRITHRLHGDRMQQFSLLGFQRAWNPRLELLAEDGTDWTWSAPLAVHYPGEHRLELLGATEGQRLPRPGQPPMTVATRDVTVRTDTREVTTAAPVRLQQPGFVLSGTGLRADLPAETLEVHHAVDTVYAPAETEVPPDG